MTKKFIDSTNGNIFISKDFTVNASTKLTDLENHFSKENLDLETISSVHCNATVYDLEAASYYFTICFYFKNEKLTHMNIYPRLEAENNSSWDNYDQQAEMDLMTAWMAIQADDNSKFVWDLSIAGRQYRFSYDWGEMGTYYDFKNGSFSCIVYYAENNIE